MRKTKKTIIAGLLLALLPAFCGTQLFAQDISDGNTYSNGGVTYTYCYDHSKEKPHEGAKINGKLVVPCKYDFIFGCGNHLFAYPGSDYQGPADVYTPDGRLLFPVSKGIVNAEYVGKLGKVLFKDQQNNWYDETGKFVLKGELSNILFGSSGEVYVKTGTYGHWGISEISGAEILAPEFEDCDYLGNGLFSFRMNGYWGVMKKDGTVIIPLSRQYSSLNYSRTFKKFTFEKRINNVVYKGECNANGVQTVIQKDHTVQTTPKQSTTSTSKPKTESSGQSSTSTKPIQQQSTQQQTIKVERDPMPVQVWKQCPNCLASVGNCPYCFGSGTIVVGTKEAKCNVCGGRGRCTLCGGQGGHYEVEYR